MEHRDFEVTPQDLAGFAVFVLWFVIGCIVI